MGWARTLSPPGAGRGDGDFRLCRGPLFYPFLRPFDKLRADGTEKAVGMGQGVESSGAPGWFPWVFGFLLRVGIGSRLRTNIKLKRLHVKGQCHIFLGEGMDSRSGSGMTEGVGNEGGGIGGDVTPVCERGHGTRHVSIYWEKRGMMCSPTLRNIPILSTRV